MQGDADRQRELLDVEAVAGHLLPAGSVFAFLAEHRSRLFPAELFAALFRSGRGQPSIPPEVVASVIVLQTLHGGVLRSICRPAPVQRRGAHRPGGTDLIGAWTRSPVTDLSPARRVRSIRQISPHGGALPA